MANTNAVWQQAAHTIHTNCHILYLLKSPVHMQSPLWDLCWPVRQYATRGPVHLCPHVQNSIAEAGTK